MKLKDLAKHLELSQTTVSRALAGYGDVSEATRERVVTAARELGYVPSLNARRLKSGRAEAIGLVMPIDRDGHAYPFFLEMIAGIGERLAEERLDLTLVTAREGAEELEAYKRLVGGRRVDGVIVARTRRKDDRIGYLLDRGFPFVAHGRTEETRPYPFLDMDGTYGIKIACKRLIGLGHRRIGYIGIDADFSFASYREQGYREALDEAMIPFDEGLMMRTPMRPELDESAVLDLIERDDPPTAVICASDGIAQSLVQVLREHGLRPGADISVIGYDDAPSGRLSDPGLTIVTHPIHDAGKTLVDLLLARIAGTDPAELQLIWKPKLALRQSDTQPPASMVA